MKARGGLYTIALKRLMELKPNPKSGIIRFPKVFEKLCSTFSITKQECWEILLTFRDLGIIKIVPNQGVKVAVRSTFYHKSIKFLW